MNYRLLCIALAACVTWGADTPRRIPDVPVLDQNGRKLSFYTDLVKGRTVAIDFIFTTCKTVCPLLTTSFRKVQQELAVGGRDVQLISISVDPVTDVPDRLKTFSEQFHAGPGWTFVTGTRPDIDSLLIALGASTGNKVEHTPDILIVNDPAGYRTRTYGLAPASDIVSHIHEAAIRKAATPADAAAAYFPNLVLTTHEGKAVHFFDDLVRDKTVVINFMFATCAGICPPMSANLSRLQKQLGARLGRDINMISITVDPAHDTPQVLADYARNFHAQPGWYFLTGTKENVDWVLYKVGGYVEDKDAHSAVLIIGNSATGEWIKLHAMGDPAQLAAAVMKIAH